MSTKFEVRRGAHVVTTKDDAASAFATADLCAHFPGQLKVYAIEHREYEITEVPAEPIPFKGSDRTAHKRRA